MGLSPSKTAVIVSLKALLFLCLAPLGKAAITACPGSASQHTGTGGANYDICPSTDYQGASDEVIINVNSTSACAELCDERGACLKAVYDNQGAVCQIKSNDADGLEWVTDERYTMINFNNALAETTDISICPYNETTYIIRDGTSYRTCVNTGFRGADVTATNNVSITDACRDLCLNYSADGCARAVYDKVESICHIKADAASNTLIWYTNKRYDIIRQEVVQNHAIEGSWSELVRFPVIPVAAYVVPAFPKPSRMLVFSSWGVNAFGGASGYTQFADYNFETGAVSQRTVSNTNHDMFCPGISSLEDGRIIISGGSNAKDTSIYNPSDNTFTKGPGLNIERGYQTSATLSDGRVFVIGGAYSGPREGKNGEVYDPSTNTWTFLPDADVIPMLTTDGEGIWREDNHSWLFGWKNASIFQAGPSANQNWYTATGTGSQVHAGVRDNQDSMCGVWAMYEPGKILSAGGSQSYTNSPATNKAHITTITEPGEPSIVEQVPSMAYPRGFANAVVLPDGQVLVTGGQNKSIVFTDTDGVLFPEIFNPATKTWKTLAPEAVPRNYHSVSLLLPDATVFSGGGGLCYVATIGGAPTCDKTVDHADGQIFSPPYLYAANGALAKRPEITAVSATNVTVGDEVTVTVNEANAKLVLVRIGSATHSVNSDQRRIPLDDVVVEGSSYTATLPSDSGILLPGFYYLFAISGAGVPSVATTLQITL